MAQPGMPGGQFPGEDALIRRVKDLERTQQQQSASNPLATAGISAVANGIIVEGSETVNGPLVVNGASEFNGSMSINGPLTLQPGSIENDSLTDPVVMATAGLTQNNFATSAGGDVFAQASVSVPAGYTRASVVCLVVAGAINSTGVIDYLYAASSINGANGGETPESASASSGYASTGANGIRTLTGLSGGTISLGCFVRTGAAWAASASNFANMNAFIYFSR